MVNYKDLITNFFKYQAKPDTLYTIEELKEELVIDPNTEDDFYNAIEELIEEGILEELEDGRIFYKGEQYAPKLEGLSLYAYKAFRFEVERPEDLFTIAPEGGEWGIYLRGLRIVSLREIQDIIMQSEPSEIRKKAIEYIKRAIINHLIALGVSGFKEEEINKIAEELFDKLLRKAINSKNKDVYDSLLLFANKLSSLWKAGNALYDPIEKKLYIKAHITPKLIEEFPPLKVAFEGKTIKRLSEFPRSVIKWAERNVSPPELSKLKRNKYIWDVFDVKALIGTQYTAGKTKKSRKRRRKKKEIVYEKALEVEE